MNDWSWWHTASFSALALHASFDASYIRILYSMALLVLHNCEALEPHIGAWEDLAAFASEPNVFYEPWMLLPAVRSYAKDAELQFVLVFVEARATANNPTILIGFFPLRISAGWHGLWMPIAEMWRYIHCYLTSPLIRRGYENECFSELFGWLDSRPRTARFVHFSMISVDGSCNLGLMGELTRRSSVVSIDDFRTRAIFRPAEDANTFLQAGLASKHRKDLRRRRARLEELGKVEVITLDQSGDVAKWTTDFLGLESRGWKGRNGTALEQDEADVGFFQSTVAGAFERGRLSMMAMLFNKMPIAMKCSFLAQDGGFAFKIAFDEAYSSYSPGLLLEVEHVVRLHSSSMTKWMDSCAVPEHFMINRLWPDRRPTQSVLIANGGGLPELLVALLPVARLLRRQWKLFKTNFPCFIRRVIRGPTRRKNS